MPLPMTISTCMYYTGKHPMTGEPVTTAKTYKERQFQRELVQPKRRETPIGERQAKEQRRSTFPANRFPRR